MREVKVGAYVVFTYVEKSLFIPIYSARSQMKEINTAHLRTDHKIENSPQAGSWNGRKKC